jgi:Ca2+-binding RTX toxin-like protein
MEITLATITVPGSGGSITITTSGTANQTLAHLISNALAGNPSLVITTYNPSVTIPGATSGKTNELAVTSGGGNFTVPSGYQYVTIWDYGTGTATTVNGAAGNEVLAGNGGLTYQGVAGFQTVVAGGGGGVNDSVNLPTGSVAFVALGAGNDTITSQGSGTLAGGGGNNLLVGAGFTSSSGSLSIISDGNDTVFAGVGYTTVAAYDMPGGISVTGGSGPLVVGSNDAYTTVTGGSGPATIWGGSGQNLVTGGTGSILFVGSSAGGTTTVNGGTGQVTIFGGAGDDINYNNPGSVGSALMVAYGGLVAGAGNETLNAAGSNVAVTLAAGAGGNVSLVGGSAGDQLMAGSGNDTIKTGAGNDSIFFWKGNAGGTDIITDFTSGSDVVILAGYGTGADTTALGTLRTTGGSSTITLSDNTTITFSNVTALTAANFKII